MALTFFQLSNELQVFSSFVPYPGDNSFFDVARVLAARPG